MSMDASQPGTRRIVSHNTTLFAETWGQVDCPEVILLHGGGQTRHAFRRVAERLAQRGLFVLVPDLRGHGDSGWSEDSNYALERFADDVRAWCASDGAVKTLVGASLGGLSSLLAAGEAPQVRVRGLVLVDVAHRGEAHGITRIVQFMRAHPTGFESFEHALEAVARYLPHRSPQGSGEGLRRNLREHEGRLVWHWDPRLLDRLVAGGERRTSSERLLAAARAVAAPILLVRGGESDVVSEAIAEEFCREVPHAERVDVGGARHMVAGDQNDPFLQAILEFVERVAR